MPYSTLVSGTTITSAWANANVRDQVVTPFASAAARSSAITSPVQGMLSYRNDLGSNGGFEGYTGTAWLPAGTQQIAATTLGSAAATVTFSSVPGAYSSLMLFVLGSLTGVGGATDCTVQINSDSGTNYSNASIDWSQANVATNSVGEAFASGDTSLKWALSLPGTSFNATRVGGVQVLFPGYSNTAMRKISMTDSWVLDNGTSFNVKKRYGYWNNTAAITTLLLTSGSGNFSTGSHFALYGMP